MYKLQSCVWEITLACCFRCEYCGSSAGKSREKELSTDECMKVAKQLADIGCKRVALIGGEVFLHPGWDIIIAALTRRGVKVSIITNGYLINSPIIDRMKAAGVESVAISLDGPKEIHDKYRRVGSFAKADEVMDELVREKIPVSIITTLNSENILYLEEFYQYLKTKPISAWQLQACCPMGNAAKGVDYHIDFAEVIGFVEKYRKEVPFMLGVADSIGYFTEEEGSIRGNQSGRAVFPGCGAGLRSIGIDSVGNVKGCESLYDDCFIEGNLREKTLVEIWNAPDAFAYNRKFHKGLLTGVCSTCEYGDVCAGGCRSYNYFTHGKMYESAACAKNKNKNQGGNEND